jgi:hypothetical protein
MKRKLYSLIGLLALGTSLAFGQVTTTSTTTTAAMTLTDPTVSLTSATNVTAPGSLNETTTLLYVDREALRVTKVAGLVISVTRGVEGTLQTPHKSGAVVYVGPPNYFRTSDPIGGCTQSTEVNLPQPSLSTGRVWNCSGGEWVSYTRGQVYAATASVLDAALATGVIIVPANPGVTYTLLGATITPVGGTVATCTAINFPDSALSTTQKLSFLISGTLAADVPHDESSGASIVTAVASFPVAYTVSKGIGFINTGSTCGTATSIVYSIRYKADF